MIVALATPVLNDGDAVGNDVLGMAGCLRSAGHTVQLVAEKARVPEDVWPVTALSPARQDCVIYHHSVQCDALVRAVEAFGDRAIVKYHNVTPARFFTEVNPDAVRGAEVGRQQAVRLARSRAAFWVDSEFNGRELLPDAPLLRPQEIPPFHQAEQLKRTRPDTDSIGGQDDWVPTLLCVGRVAPNKNLELAIRTLAAVRATEPDARLIVAGEHVFPRYSTRMADLAESLGLSAAVKVTGRVSTAQLHALYRSADILLITSEHEGFCVPIVEAMCLGVPVVAVPRTAVPDTGGAAVRYAKADCQALARVIQELLTDGPQRERQVLAGWDRYASRFSPAAITARFHELFKSAIAGWSSPPLRRKADRCGRN